jgi:hypothetical protein
LYNEEPGFGAVIAESIISRTAGDVRLLDVLIGRIRGSTRQTAKAAKLVASHEFRRLYPDERVSWTTLRSDEETRFVIGVYYGSTKPPRYKFFEVTKDVGSARELQDDANYRPSVWR